MTDNNIVQHVSYYIMAGFMVMEQIGDPPLDTTYYADNDRK